MNKRVTNFDSKPRILIVDNDTRTRLAYQALMTHWGYTPILAEGDGKALLEDAQAKARNFRCQLALVDMRLLDDFDEDDKSGLELIAKLKPASCIMVSARADLADAREGEERGAAGFVGKGEGPKVLKEKLEKEAQKICAQKKGLNIESPETMEYTLSILFENISAQYYDQITDILIRLFPNARSLKMQKLGSGVTKVGISSAPRPNSVVLKVSEDGKEPQIVKLARVEKIKREKELYEKFINGRLVGQFNSLLLDTQLLWDIGGLKYTFVGTKEQNFSSLFAHESVENINKSLERFFTSVWSKHYANAKEETNYSLFDNYFSAWGGEKWYRKALNLEHKATGSSMNIDLLRNIQPPNPITWLRTRISEDKEKDTSRIPKTKSAITHGDLHADNMLIDETGIAWVIDFERSGEGHIFRDFIELESDIIHRLAYSNENLRDYVRLCVEIARHKSLSFAPASDLKFSDQKIEKAFQVISHLRELAQAITQISDAREYLLGLYFDTLFYATIAKKDDARQQRAFMLASILCLRLENWETAWPPQEWLTHI